LPSKSGIRSNRRDDEFLRSFFQSKVENTGSSSLNSQQFTSALEEIGIFMQADDVEVLFRTMDVNNDGAMDLEEFNISERGCSKFRCI
jgi:Ca2+-binding EF-hand superfamily protein